MSSVTGSRFGALDPNIGGSPPLLVDREHEALGIARFIVEAGQRVVVLYGGARSGKTELVTHWIIPELEQTQGPLGWGVFYGKCEHGLPSILKSRSGNRRLDELEDQSRLILVLDNFDRVLGLPRDQRVAACDALFERVAREGAEHIVVLVTDARQLTNVYGLSSYEPGLMKAVRELGTASVDESLHRLSSVAPETAVAYTDEALTALSDDGRALEERGFEVSFDLIILVDRHFRELAMASDGADRTIDTSDVRRAEGLVGILKERMERGIHAVASASAERAAVARTILEDVLSAHGAPPDRTDVALRVGVANDVVDSVAAGLLAPDGLLRQAGHELAFFPAQLAAAVSDEIAADKPFVDQTRRIVEEGLRSWTLLGDLLSGERFDEVHRWRRHLALDDDRCRFLLLSALRLEEEPKASAASSYWLGRIEDREDAQDILLSAALDKDPHVRARGVEHLGAFPNADVQDRLTIIALVDEDTNVRAKAVASLQRMKNETLRQRLVQEIESHAANRVRAIQVLRVFPDEKTVSLLKRFVSDTATEKPVREAAIAVLATVNSAESVDALIQIGLHDVDEDDRTSAAVGLALTRSDERNRQIVTALGPLSHIPLLKWRVAAISLLVVASIIGVGLGTLAMGVVVLTLGAATTLALLVAAFALPWFTSRRLRRMRESIERTGKAKRDLLTVALLVVFITPMCLALHGLAHALVGRWRRAAFLFAMQLLGIFLLSIASAFADVAGGMLQGFYVLVGLVLVIGSYFYDVLPVMADTVFVSRGVEKERRKEAIYRHLLSNAEVVTLLLHQLRSDNKAERFAARHLVRRFAARAQPSLIDFLDASDPLYTEAATRGFRVTKDHDTVQQLEALWAKANPRLRARIADILASSPTQSSIQALERVRPDLSLWAKIRFSFAKAEFRLRVWPIYLRALAVVSLPALILFVRIGYSALGNSAWSQLVAVDRYMHGAALNPIGRGASPDEKRRMIATIAFLARNYPEQAAPPLIEHFKESHNAATDPPVRAALARALIVLWLDRKVKDSADIKPLEPALVDAILAGDSVTFARATDDLSGVRGLNPALGTALLQRIILTRGTDSAERWKPRAIRAMGNMDYSIALPALDSLLKARSEGPLARVVRAQLSDVVAKTLDSARVAADPTGEAKKLLAVLEGLKPTPIQTDVVRRFADSVAKAKVNPGNDPLLAQIHADSAAEDGYTELLARFDQNRRYKAALDTFALLKRQFPGVIWPRKIIANIQHERIATPAAFDAAYLELVELRALPAYHALAASDSDTHSSMEADFAEIALSAKAYDDVEKVGATLLADASLPPDRRLNAALFIYFGRVMQRNVPRASDALTRVDSIVESASSSFYNNWVYPGTRASLMGSGLPPTVRDALLKLCREQYWYSGDSSAAVLKQNRDALRLLGGK